ncbi:DCR1A-like protein, partial [Mya arenaria]
TSFTVDAFRYGLVSGCRVYFLSHFHYDHYAGLTKSCPGAALILFKLKERKVYLHTGDFRACREMESYPELQNLRNDVIQFTVKLAREVVHQNPKTLVVCGSYTIGKERIFVGNVGIYFDLMKT